MQNKVFKATENRLKCLKREMAKPEGNGVWVRKKTSRALEEFVQEFDEGLKADWVKGGPNVHPSFLQDNGHKLEIVNTGPKAVGARVQQHGKNGLPYGRQRSIAPDRSGSPCSKREIEISSKAQGEVEWTCDARVIPRKRSEHSRFLLSKTSIS